MTHLRLMFDSGAFSAQKQDLTIDLDEYISFLHGEISRFGREAFDYISLDVIGDGRRSYENWCEMRKQGLDPIPVYHAGTDIGWLQKYLDSCDFVALGAMANIRHHRRVWFLDRIWRGYLLDSRGCPRCKVHGLGSTSFRIMQRYPWYSVDSTAHVQHAAAGWVVVPKRDSGGWNYLAAPHRIRVTGANQELFLHDGRLSHWHDRRRAILFGYLDWLGFPTSAGRKRTIVIDFALRSVVNLLYYIEAFSRLPWPRVCDGRGSGGFFASTMVGRVGGKDSMVGSSADLGLGPSVFFAGGSMVVENFLQACDRVPGGVGILLSYFDVGIRRNALVCRRYRALLRGEMCEVPGMQKRFAHYGRRCRPWRIDQTVP